MHSNIDNYSVCSGTKHFHRRTLLRAAGGGLFLSPLASILARAAEVEPAKKPKSIILLWLEGGASQLETFDPHPGTKIGGDIESIATSATGVVISDLLPQTAEQMDNVALLRAVTSKEGDHLRAVYNIKTGFRPDPTLVHPSVGAILCHESQQGADIPRHISILPGNAPARAGYLGAKYDAFKVYDPAGKVPDVTSSVDSDRLGRRLADLASITESEFSKGRLRNAASGRTLHPAVTAAAMEMMSSDQLTAFDISQEPRAVQKAFGSSSFGRGCLAAARLIEVGVRCVEVTLGGWDSHINNHNLHVSGCEQLDPAFASLIQRLKDRDLLESTLIVCGGEFGRTPQINPAEGRDHWPHGFSIALAGCGIRGGTVFGETNPDAAGNRSNPTEDLVDSVTVSDVHRTILKTLGVNYDHETITPIGRPMKYSEGRVIDEILV
jgi:hypothetical protein